jgi:hypothetical protein
VFIALRPLFTYTHISVVYETLRLFPAALVIPKRSATDTTIVVGNEAGENVVIPIPKGTSIDIHVSGVHYNRAPSVTFYRQKI